MLARPHTANSGFARHADRSGQPSNQIFCDLTSRVATKGDFTGAVRGNGLIKTQLRGANAILLARD